MNSITRRWVRGSLLITILVMLLAMSVIIYFSITSAYDSARRAVQTRVTTILNQFSASDAQTSEARGIMLRRMIEQFSEKDKFEVLLLTEGGQIAVSSSGSTDENSFVSEDYFTARSSESGAASSVSRIERTGEKIMSVTALLSNPADGVTAVRVETSLTLIDAELSRTVALTSLLAFAIVLFSVWSGMFFIRSIVRPIGEIENTAAKIAQGNLDIRIENKYNDEIGKLSDTINHMAGELDKSERMKNEFISSVSHELRTPLTSIKGWAETMAAINDVTDANYRRGIQVIQSETDRLYVMVEELLDFSRMQNGLKLDTHLLDLVAEISDSCITAEQRYINEGIALVWSEPELPIPVMADSARLRQVFINILDNAAKYSPKGGTVTVDTLIDNFNDNVYVNFTDEGAGIAPDDLENVKKKFFKGKGAVRGSGIGLAVVDEITTAHGGALDIQSKLGEGTTVTVRLPIYRKGAKQIEQ